MAERKPRRVPIGKIKPWSDKTIKRISTVKPEDIEKAKAETPPELAALLDAEQREDKTVGS